MDLESPIDAAAQLPAVEDITLLFKHHKSTTLISIPPNLSLSDIKARLLAVLHSRGIETLTERETPLPSRPNDLEFGILVDRKDASKGWIPLDNKEQDMSDIKAGKRKVSVRKGGPGDNSTSHGLSDGMWIAYRVKKNKSKAKPANASGDAGGDDLDIDIEMEDDLDWDVVIPSFEDEGE